MLGTIDPSSHQWWLLPAVVGVARKLPPVDVAIAGGCIEPAGAGGGAGQSTVLRGVMPFGSA